MATKRIGKPSRTDLRTDAEDDSDHLPHRSMTISQFADWFQLEERAVRRLISARYLSAIYATDRALRITPKEVRRFIRDRVAIRETTTGSGGMEAGR
jgi:hypothetical protein